MPQEVPLKSIYKEVTFFKRERLDEKEKNSKEKAP